jgi:small GTP-binding protein
MKEKLRYILSIKDCYFNQRTLDFKNALDGSHIMSSNQLLNILLVGPSRAGKSTLCNTLLNKYEVLESSATESVTDVVNEYSNEYFHIYDTPGITITKNKGLGDTSKNIVELLKEIIKKADDSIDDIHVIFFVLKYNPNVENMKPIFQFLDKENEKRSKENMCEIPIIFIINEQKDTNNENDEFEDINKFEQTARSLKNYLEKNEIKTLYSNYTDHEINEEEDHNIIRVDIRRERNAVNRIFKKLNFYIRKNNPFSPQLFEKMGEIKNNFEKINAIKKRPNLSDKEKDRVNEELKKNKEECQKIILQIREENSWAHLKDVFSFGQE